MATKKKPVRSGMRVKAYAVLERAVEEGFQYGWYRSHKHTDTPSRGQIEADVTKAIMDTICDVFDFEEPI